MIVNVGELHRDLHRIVESGTTREKKIIMLWLITQINYRGPVGEEAGELLKGLIGDQEVCNAVFQIIGFALANPSTEICIKQLAEMCRGVLD